MKMLYKIKFLVEVVIVIVSIYAILNLFELPIPIKYKGFVKGTVENGLIAIFIVIVLILINRFLLKEPKVYYCKKCDTILNEDEVLNGKCTKCKSKTH